MTAVLDRKVQDKCVVVTCSRPAAPGKRMCAGCDHYFRVVLADERYRTELPPERPL